MDSGGFFSKLNRQDTDMESIDVENLEEDEQNQVVDSSNKNVPSIVQT